MSNKSKNKRQILAEPTSASKKRIRSSTSSKETPATETENKVKLSELFEKDSEKNDSSTEADVKIELPAFTSSDLNKLLENIKKSLPEGDQLKYNTRLEKLDWESLKLENFTIDECKKILSHTFSFVRKFKTLNEVLTDAMISASKPNSRIYKSNKNNLKPKHPSSSYMIFANEIRDKLRKQYPNASIIEIGKMIGEKWRSLSNLKKEKYVKKFEENKKVYLEEVSKYNIKNNNQDKKKKDSDKPKTPLMIYLNEKISKNNPDLENLSFKEKQNYYRNKYNSLSDKKKFKYITKCLEAEEVYKEKLKDKFKTQNVEFKSVLNKMERELVEKMNGKPSNPPVNGYSLFVKENIIKPEFSSIEPKQRNQSLAIKWKALNKEEKEQYNVRAKDKKEKFLLEMSSYVQNLPEKEAVELYMRNGVGFAKDIIMKRLEIS